MSLFRRKLEARKAPGASAGAPASFEVDEEARLAEAETVESARPGEEPIPAEWPPQAEQNAAAPVAAAAAEREPGPELFPESSEAPAAGSAPAGPVESEAPAAQGGESEAIELSDAPPPAAGELVDPGEYLRGRVNLIGRAPDTRSTQMIFEIAALGSDDWRALGTARAPFHLPVDSRQLVDGEYELRIESLGADGQSTYSRRFGRHVVDNTPPRVAVVQPDEGERLEGWVELTALAEDDTSGVARVELSYTEAGEWRLLAELEPKGGSVHGYWQTGECEPGRCQLRATAFDRAGNEASHVIAVTIAPAPAAIEAEQAAAPSEPEPVAGRFGAVPSWDWNSPENEGKADRPEPERAEQPEPVAESEPSDRPEPAGASEQSEEPEPAAEREPSEAPEPQKRPAKSVVWHWKSPEPFPALDESERRPEVEPEFEREPETTKEPVSEQTPTPEKSDSEEDPLRKIRLTRPAAEHDAQEPAEEATESGERSERREQRDAGSRTEEGGRVVDFPRTARGWDIWELSDLLEKTPGQDPARREERRQILYHLREHTAVDGRIPPEFEDLIAEEFGDLMPDDSGA